MFKISLIISLTLFLSIPLKASDGSGFVKLIVTRDHGLLNGITGQVMGPDNRPVPNLSIELNNEVNSTVARQRTSSLGRYEFTNISSGLFRIRVLTLGTDYLEQVQEVQILNLVPGMSDIQYCDFRLKYDPMKVNIDQDRITLTGEVFAQEGVTPQAEKHYKKGLDLLKSKNSDEAIAEFKQAIALVPNYYYALNALGLELLVRGKYGDSFPYLVKAIDINSRSFSSYWALAYALYQSGHLPQAIEAAKAATILKPGSIEPHLLLGTALRQIGNYPDAEKALLKAKANCSNKMSKVNWQLALLYNRMNKNKEAADELDTYLKNDPNVEDRVTLKETIVKLRNSVDAKIQ